MMPTMMNILELEQRRPEPTTTKIMNMPLVDPGGDREDRAHQNPPKPSREKSPCLWCQRAFMPRATGGSRQRFCSTGHRQVFWIAARRWTLRALDAGLISVECLKTN